MPNNNDTYAAIDMGSNSFHMLVVQDINGVPRTIAKIKRKVRLASGLDSNNMLDDAAMQRGWQCLSLFAERLTHIPKQNISIVSTATLRLAKNADVFCAKGNAILGLPINVISGDEEAALIYHGMAVSSHSANKRLIVDIGGASTELILGQGFKPLVLNSLNMGCVTWLEQYFSDGLLSQSNIDQGMAAAKEVLAPFKQDYLAHQWQLALGASGSIQAVQEVLVAQGLNEEITLSKLEVIVEQTIACERLTMLSIDGLKEERKLVFVSGLVILLTLFKELNIEGMIGSGGALREGLIDQLISHNVPSDIRLNCCQKMQQRFQLDVDHATDVADTAELLVRQLADKRIAAQDMEMLRYSALLHEVGTSVEFLNAAQHGYYLISHSPMAGFSKEQRKLVAALVGSYKNTLDIEQLHQQAWCAPQVAQLLATCLRLAIIIAGRYQHVRSELVQITLANDSVNLHLTKELAELPPLFLAEIEQELIDNNHLKLIH